MKRILFLCAVLFFCGAASAYAADWPMFRGDMSASWEIVRPTFGVLLDGGVSKEQYDRIAETIISFPEVRNFEKLRTRHLGPSGLTFGVHVRVDEGMSVLDSHELTRKITRKPQDENPNIVEVAIHIEPA